MKTLSSQLRILLVRPACLVHRIFFRVLLEFAQDRIRYVDVERVCERELAYDDVRELFFDHKSRDILHFWEYTAASRPQYLIFSMLFWSGRSFASFHWKTKLRLLAQCVSKSEHRFCKFHELPGFDRYRHREVFGVVVLLPVALADEG